MSIPHLPETAVAAVQRACCGGHGNHSGHMTFGRMPGRMGADQMDMTFFTGIHTPLFSNLWTPQTEVAYAGICIFLVVFTIIMQALLAFKPVFEQAVFKKVQSRRCGSPNNGGGDAEQAKETGAAKTGRFAGEMKKRWAAGSYITDVCRASYMVVLLGMGYLLMLGVMTMNVGYFLSVLAGAFVGQFLFGRFGADFYTSPDACH